MKTDIETGDIADITSFVPTENTVLPILTQDGRPTGWKWTLCAPGNPKAVAFADDQARRNLHKQKLIEQAQVNGKKYQSEENTPEQARRENVGWIIARVIDFTPVKLFGEVYTFSDKTAEDLLIKPELGFVLTQVSEALNADKLFTKTSAKP
ncbi:hypothetical protein [Mesorhizobium sp. M0968]|uniref:hypothetical protein n=1 Tax=Mesorhizobium sp. M0968 TaxID=2957037 RepID=UPI003336F874